MIIIKGLYIDRCTPPLLMWGTVENFARPEAKTKPDVGVENFAENSPNLT